MARPKKYRNYEDFLIDVGEYFATLNFSAYLNSLTPNEIIKDKKRISLLTEQDITQDNVKVLAAAKKEKAMELYSSLVPMMRNSKDLPFNKMMTDFGLSELEAMMILYLSWQEMMTERVYLYTRTIVHLLKLMIGSDREALSRLKYFGSDSALMKSGLIYLDRHSNSPIGSSDVIVIDEVQEALMNMVEYDLEKIKKKRTRIDTSHSPGHGDFTIDEPNDIKLILPDETMQLLNKVETYILHKERIMKDWGLSQSITYGSAMALLFHGPPGTGKTLAAKYLSAKTGKKLIIADYAELMNKYVGETEKKIKGLFNKANGSDAILLIDEVDSLVSGRRDDSRSWEVSHVNTTLQAIEGFDGVIIFATNREDLLDKALERRILIKVEFVEPNEANRELIWRSIFTNVEALDSDVDFSVLSKKFAFPGGNIKNAALMAALNAAERGHQQITQEDIIDAAKVEAGKTKLKGKMGFSTTREDD